MIGHSTRLASYSLGIALVLAGCSDEATRDPGVTATAGASGMGVPAVAGSTAGSLAGIGSPGSSGRGAAGSGIGVAGATAGRGTAGAGIAGAGTAGAGTSGIAGQGSTPPVGAAGAPPIAGAAGMMATAGAGTAGAGTAGAMAPPSGMGCTPAPTAMFQTMTKKGGPGGNYTIVQPTTLGEGGFKHPPIAWGNGVTTTPALYVELLNNLAANGFVVIADPGPTVTPAIVRQGLEWLIEQNGSGEYAGKLAVDCAGTIGYSMGGGSAVGAGSHPAVKAIVSFHGLQDQAGKASGPILLTTSEGDTFVTKSGFVEPCYNASTKQPTILASHAGGDHLDPLGDGGEDAAPGLAWLRYWIYGDQSQKDWFFGDNCKLCSWPDFRRKNHPEWN